MNAFTLSIACGSEGMSVPAADCLAANSLLRCNKLSRLFMLIPLKLSSGDSAIRTPQVKYMTRCHASRAARLGGQSKRCQVASRLIGRKKAASGAEALNSDQRRIGVAVPLGRYFELPRRSAVTKFSSASNSHEVDAWAKNWSRRRPSRNHNSIGELMARLFG